MAHRSFGNFIENCLVTFNKARARPTASFDRTLLIQVFAWRDCGFESMVGASDVELSCGGASKRRGLDLAATTKRLTGASQPEKVEFSLGTFEIHPAQDIVTSMLHRLIML